ncbi:helix-turn-helix domain-containing protein [Streptomyces triculaminicus]|uniref:helix-turn-helix domain-containing protein n=1 Tax=Streptomyces triculaminicus TaxID=2816232 RepID=UPI0037D8DDD7
MSSPATTTITTSRQDSHRQRHDARAGAHVPVETGPVLVVTGPLSGRRAAPVARVTGHTLGFLRVSTVRGPASVVTPAGVVTSPDITAVHHVIAAVHERGVATFIRHGEVLACGPGDLVVLDPGSPFAFDEAEDFELHLVAVPRHVLGLAQADLDHLFRRHPHADSHVAPLLTPLLQGLAASAPHRSPRTADHLAASVAELLRTLAAETRALADAPTAEPDGPGRHGLAGRLRAYANEHLGDRGLTPEAVARHHHVSVRLLHKAFAAEGTTISRWIQQRRLEECRRELARPGRLRPAVASVARHWGFAGSAHFSRRFRAAYGMSPTAWRDRHTAPGRLPEA